MTTEGSIEGAELRAAPYATLDGLLTSRQALERCEALEAAVLTHRPNGTLRKNGLTKTQRQALEALLADILERDPSDKGGWVYKGLARQAFSRERVGYVPFIAVYVPLRDAGFIQQHDATRDFLDTTFSGGKTVSVDWATRFRATDKLRQWFAASEISHTNWSDHFRREKYLSRREPPLELRITKADAWQNPERGKKLKLNRSDETVAALIKRMDRLNAFLFAQDIQPYGPVSLRRVFNNGDQPDYGWDIGGRPTCLGKSYQRAKKHERAAMTFNGEGVAEIDIRASHLTLMVALGHLPRDLIASDPYEVPGIPRDIVKMFVTITLGNGKRHRQWPREKQKEWLEKHGIDLAKAYPLKATGDAILAKLPILSEAGLVFTHWGKLQFMESEALLSAMETLAYKHGVVSLPVHDSLIVPRSKVDLGTKVLRESFKAVAGLEPMLTVGV